VNPPPRFISDAMLGSLSKWLRILGFDTLYFTTINDNEIIKLARQEQRILLTKDIGLIKNKKVNSCIQIKSDDVLQQLKEVLSVISSGQQFDLSPRCPECNGTLALTDRGAIAGDVPEHVFLNFNSFFRCMNCGKVYWEGSHKRLIDRKIEQVFKEINVNWKNSGTN